MGEAPRPAQPPSDEPALLLALFEARADQTPDAPAVSFGSQTLTYGELERRANRLARHLVSLGVGPEDRVGICLNRSIEMVVALLGVLKSGAAYLPLDPAFPRDRLRFMLEDAAPKVLLADPELDLPAGETPRIIPGKDEATHGSDADRRLPAAAKPENLAYVIYTSGSTGRPKGVEITHRALANFLRSMAREPGLTPRDTFFSVTTLSFDIAALELFLPLSMGARVVVSPRDTAMDGSLLAEALAACGATAMQATPTTWRMLLQAGWKGDPKLKILCGGEALPRDLANALLGCGRELWNLYGPTETTIWSTLARIETRDGPVTIGRPIDHTDVLILDENGRPAPRGETGELCIGGRGLARGYWKRPELTAERFIPHPQNPAGGERVYRTGDLARLLPDGNLECLGRIDHQVKIRGFRIELGEIEAALREHPQVRDAVVVARDESGGHRALAAYLVPDFDRAAPDPDKGKAGLDTLDAERISQWMEVWDETYRRPEPDRDPTFNVTGWVSSYTGEPIPEEEMREWVDGTVQRIEELAPRRVLEIGCGSGLLLFRLAPRVERYVGMDFSLSALERVREQAARMGLAQVELLHRVADDFQGLKPGDFDTVILNSVAQYFPNLAYLSRVLEGAAALLAPGGRIFVGDVRSLPLLEAFHAGVALHRGAEDTPVAELRRTVAQRIAQEEELLVDPEFFRGLPASIPRLGGISLRPKPGRFPNEMTLFRYDAVLAATPAPGAAAAAGERLDWKRAGLHSTLLREQLSRTPPSALYLTGVPDARLARALGAAALLRNPAPPPTAGALREALSAIEAGGGADPRSLAELGREHRLQAEVILDRSGVPGELEACFFPAGARPVWATPASGAGGRPLANDPLRGKLARRLMPQVRALLRQKLPDYMMPSAFVLLEALPLTPNGKVDRKALPAPERERSGAERDARPPRDELEKFLVELWSEVLDVDPVGIGDDFFALGGESIKGAVLAAKLRERLGEIVYPTVLFQAPTVEKLALYLRERYVEAVGRCFGIRTLADSNSAAASALDFNRVLEFRRLIPALPSAPERGPRNRRVVFLLTAPRSGSTLLRVMLAGHPKIFAPPELELLNFNTLGERRAELTGQFAFWQEGVLRAVMELKGCDAGRAREIMKELEDRNLSCREFYGLMQEWIGERLLVDKSTSYALDKSVLDRAERDFVNPAYIHLVRHPCAMIQSFEKSQMQQVFFRPEHRYAPRELAELVWLVSQMNIRDFLVRIPEERKCQVRFEDLVRDPKPALQKICRAMDLDFEPEMLAPYRNKERKMTDGLHQQSIMLGDVKFLEHKEIDPSVADAWRNQVSPDLLGRITQEQAAHLGYLTTPAGSVWRSLIPMQKHGRKRPLFCIHPGGGSVLSYGAFLRYVDPDRPVYGLEARGLTDGSEPQTRISEMASDYIREIRTVQPEGPYLLAGRCLGGFIAFEMAQQLIRAGQSVSFLGLFDPLHAPPLHPEEEPAVVLEETPDHARPRAAKPSRLSRKVRKIGKRIQEWFAYQKLPPEEKRLKRFVRIQREARKHYLARVFPGRIHLWRNGGMVANTRHEVRWAALARSGLRVYVIPGEHFSMFREPLVQDLAQQLNECLSGLE